MNILLGCIADDFTGATDLAGLLARSGMPVRLHLGVPDADSTETEDQARFEIIALKCRNSPASEAVEQVLQAYRWLSSRSARRLYWKYCSTFDSTADGNIGPVADALLDAIAADRDMELPLMTLHCPAFPENGRSVYMGQLFVGNQLLHESPMKDHPLTPMRDSDIGRLLGAQTKRSVGKLSHPDIGRDQDDIRASLDQLAEQGVTHVIGDAVSDADLVALVRATERFPLICGGSALALHLPALFRVRGFLSSADVQTPSPAPQGAELVLSGSCSEMTRKQIQAWSSAAPSLMLDPLKLNTPEGRDAAMADFDKALHAAAQSSKALLVYASAAPEVVRQAQEVLGVEAAGGLIESVLAECAVHAIANGVRRLVVAGGETSGAVSLALGIRQLAVGHEIVPGVPWCRAEVHDGVHADTQQIAIALKSGNFGGEYFFIEALQRIEPPPSEVAPE